MSKLKRLPTRDKVKPQDTWDLSRLYASDEAWQRDLKKLKGRIAKFAGFSGHLADSAESLAACLKFDADFDRLGERLGTYAFLKTAEDQTNQNYQSMLGQFQSVAARASEAASFIRPEILSIPAAKMKTFLKSSVLEPYRLLLDRVLRYKPYTLSNREEQLLAMQAEMSQAAGHAFRQLLDADMKFGEIENEKGERIQLTNSTFSSLLISPARAVRKKAFEQYYQQFEGHENTLAATLAGSIHKDIYYARAHGYDSALQSALFRDNLPASVYDQLIASVHRFLPTLHRYYELRRNRMKLKQIHHYDTYVPILSDLETKYTWKQAVNVVLEAMRPLGAKYCDILRAGLEGRWCDRYPNHGKQSGAFSCGSFDGDPYILMNYQPSVLNDVFTLRTRQDTRCTVITPPKTNPIFITTTRSSWPKWLVRSMKNCSATICFSKRRTLVGAYLINREIDDIRGTIFRQTMFAEFEKIVHEMGEAGEPLTLQAFRDAYRKLLKDYFGPEFTLDDCLSRECLRIPHFYRAFYVFKYATGLSAAIALSQRVLNGGAAELQEYLGFLSGGCSQDPLDLLRGAGVDMASPQPVNTALEYFDSLVTELDSLL